MTTTALTTPSGAVHIPTLGFGVWQVPDEEAFPAVRLAKQVGRAGGEYPAVFNAANEQAVAAFHAGRIGFTDIVDTVRDVVESHEASSADLTVDSLAEAERTARRQADLRIARR